MSVKTQNVKEFFDVTEHYLAKRYDVSLRADIVRDMVGDLQHARVLDIGCGDGSISLQYATPTNQLVLVDLSANMLRLAQRRTPPHVRSNVQYVNADLMTFRPADQFDLVLCIGVLAHVASIEATVRIVAQFLKPGGQCVFQITDNDTPAGKLFNAYYRGRDRRKGRPYQLNILGRDRLLTYAADHGLMLVNECRYLPPLPGMGRLPDPWLYQFERLTRRSQAFLPAGSELLALFRKRG
ncbi:MAG: methyltransferase domain-containing protein [Chloroflexota bacterium]